MKRRTLRAARRGMALAAVATAIGLVLGAVPAAAHFQTLVPSRDVVGEGEAPVVRLSLAFTHPMQRGPLMEMAPPARFGVHALGKTTDLLPTLKAKPVDGKTTFEAEYRFQAPGDYVFFVEPAPYWEPAEEKMIVHYTKVVVDFASGDGWDALVGLPVEIEPLVRPYGLWTGNLFRGVVRKAGQPVPFAEVEVEWLNDGSVTAPADPFVTQVVKADANGVFAYAIPRAGWWGFAALLEADTPMQGPTGKDVPVETGAVMWVHAVDMK